MKKSLVTLFLVGVLVLALADGALANSIYVGSLVSSEWERTLSNHSTFDGDLEGLIISGDFAFGRWVVGFDYSDRTSKLNGSDDSGFDTYYIKGGYKLTDKLALTLGYYKLSCNHADDTAIIIGLGGIWNLSNNSRIDASLGYSLTATSDPTAAGVADNDESILLSSVKYSYFFTNKLGISLGYQYENFNADDTAAEYTTSGPTAGLTYRF